MSRLSELQFRITQAHEPVRPPVARVELRVDGCSLIEMVRLAERPFALREDVPALAGNYDWPRLSPRLIRLLAGERPPTAAVSMMRRPRTARDEVLLNCECGLLDCWPLAMQVRLQPRIVTWSNFCQMKRNGRGAPVWGYEEFEPLCFARDAYEQCIAELRVAWIEYEGTRLLNGKALHAPLRQLVRAI